MYSGENQATFQRNILHYLKGQRINEAKNQRETGSTKRKLCFEQVYLNIIQIIYIFTI
jgi:hypothetical protein